MLSWFKRKTKKVSQQIEADRTKRKQNKIYQSDIEVAAKYITKRSEKAAFAEDMGLKTRATKRLVIPKSVTVNGLTLVKYTGYENNLDLATEAAEDMRELGYKTKIVTYYRGSAPVYVLYRYKQGVTINNRPTKKPVAKPTIPKVAAKARKAPSPKKKHTIKKKPTVQPWHFC